MAISNLKHVSLVDITESEKYKQIGADEKVNSTIGDTVHYLSPASLSTISVHGEDQSPSLTSTEFYKYLNQQELQYDEYYGSVYSRGSSATIEVPQLERTLAIIKPDAVYYEDVIVRKILRTGFKILQKRKIHLTPEQVSELYSQYYGELSFPYLVVSMSAAPVIVMCLTSVNAVSKWKQLVKNTGTIHYSWFHPKSIRIRFGLPGSLDNMLHASDDILSANREIRYFFPQTIIEPLMYELNEVTAFLDIYVNPTLIDALTDLCKKRPIEPLIHFAEWLLLNNPYQPKLQPELAKLPT